MEGHTPVLQFSVVTKEDIDQEVELLKLQGVPNPSRSIIAKRLATRELFFGEGELENAAPIFHPRPQAPDHVLEGIIDFALANQEFTESIMSFLDDPEARLTETLELLGISESPLSTLPLAKILEDALPATLNDLYALARITVQNERPEATVRQWLRRNKRNGNVTVVNDLIQKA